MIQQHRDESPREPGKPRQLLLSGEEQLGGGHLVESEDVAENEGFVHKVLR